VGTDEAAERRSPETAIARDGDRRLTIVGTRFAGETTPYRSFQLMCESEIVAADERGREWVLRLYGSAMVKDGRYKIFSCVVDDRPRIHDRPPDRPRNIA
jgi:hypothetical protein